MTPISKNQLIFFFFVAKFLVNSIGRGRGKWGQVGEHACLLNIIPLFGDN
jgi:hypothetical protein